MTLHHKLYELLEAYEQNAKLGHLENMWELHNQIVATMEQLSK